VSAARPWTLGDLSGTDREYAEAVLDRVFSTAPGSAEAEAALAEFAALDRAIESRR
jgi:hypothetical protein